MLSWLNVSSGVIFRSICRGCKVEAKKDAFAEWSILIVDDDSLTRETISFIVARNYPDANIYTAENGRAGLEVFEGYRPEIIITDIEMPEMTGIKMAGHIKSIKSDARFIVVTGNSDDVLFEDFRGIGFCDFILKPIDLRRLFAVIERCLAEMSREQRLATGRVPRVGEAGHVSLVGAVAKSLPLPASLETT